MLWSFHIHNNNFIVFFSYSSLAKSADDLYRLRKKQAHNFTAEYLKEQYDGLEPEHYFKTMSELSTKFPKLMKFGKILSDVGKSEIDQWDEMNSTSESQYPHGRIRQDSDRRLSAVSESETGSFALPINQEMDNTTIAESESIVGADNLTLPPIQESDKRQENHEHTRQKHFDGPADIRRHTSVGVRRERKISESTMAESSAKHPRTRPSASSRNTQNTHRERKLYDTDPVNSRSKNKNADDQDNESALFQKRSTYIQTGHKGSRREKRLLNRQRQAKTAPMRTRTDPIIHDDESELKDNASNSQNSKMIQAFLRQSSAMPAHNTSQQQQRRNSRHDDILKQVMRQYEEYRGLKSKEYAIKCLNLASSFKEKPWLHQVRQAMAIASQGVKKTISGRPHLFMSEMEAKNTKDKYGLADTPRSVNAIPV